MDFLTGIAIFYLIKLCFYICIFLALMLLFFIIPKKIKKSLLTKSINYLNEPKFLRFKGILFFLATIISIFISNKLMLNIKIYQAYQISLICTMIDGLRFSFGVYYNKSFIKFLTFKDILYKYLQK